jgi:hypothetical protein
MRTYRDFCRDWGSSQPLWWLLHKAAILDREHDVVRYSRTLLVFDAHLLIQVNVWR